MNPRPVWDWGLSPLLCYTRGHLCKLRCKSFQNSDSLPTSCQLWTYHSAHLGCLQLCSFFCETAPVSLNKHLCKWKGVKQLDEQNWKLYPANMGAGYSHILLLVLQAYPLLYILFIHVYMLSCSCAHSLLLNYFAFLTPEMGHKWTIDL